MLATADADRIAAANDSFHATVSSTRLLIVVATIAGALLAVGVAVWITLALRMRVRRVLSRLQHLRDDDVRGLADGLEAVANGDMTVEVRTSTRPIQRISSDEIGEVSLAVNAIHATTLTSLDAYNRMRARVARILGEIAHSSASVAAASQQMATTSEETGRAIGEIATTVSEVAQGADRQVRSVKEARELTAEVAAAMQQSAGDALETASAAQQARAVAEEGAAAVDARDRDDACRAGGLERGDRRDPRAGGEVGADRRHRRHDHRHRRADQPARAERRDRGRACGRAGTRLRRRRRGGAQAGGGVLARRRLDRGARGGNPARDRSRGGRRRGRRARRRRTAR